MGKSPVFDCEKGKNVSGKQIGEMETKVFNKTGRGEGTRDKGLGVCRGGKGNGSGGNF